MAQTSGNMTYGYGLGPGVTTQKGLTLPGGITTNTQSGGISASPGVAGAALTATGGTSTLWWLFGIALLLIALKFAVEREKSPMQLHYAGISFYNFVVVGLLAVLFIVPAKVIFNKYPVKGLTNLLNAT